MHGVKTKKYAISVPSLIHSRFNAGCAIFNSPLHNFRPVILAVGGLSQATAEIYDYTQPNAKWTESKINSIRITIHSALMRNQTKVWKTKTGSLQGDKAWS